MSFDIDRQDIADALRAEADAHGRTVEAELAALVERIYGGDARVEASRERDNWVQELIDIAHKIDLEQGIEPYLPPRTSEGYEPVRL